MVAIRAFLVGTKQGALLENLMKNVDIRKIFQEEVNPANQSFRRDFSSILALRRTFDDPPQEVVFLAIKTILVLKNLSFFGRKNRNDAKQRVSFIGDLTDRSP